MAINNGDDNATIHRYVRKEKFTFPIVHGTEKTFSAFGVQAYPTNYLVDASGRVVFRSVGFDEAGIRKALAKLGVK